MSGKDNIRLWDTLFELKEDHPRLGFIGQTFFVSDFASEISAEEIDLKYIVSYTSFNGMSLGKGICSYIMTKEQIKELFNPLEKTFVQMEKEIREQSSGEEKSYEEELKKVKEEIMNENEDV